MLVKLGQLRVADLDIILRTNNIPVVGNKQAKIDELTRILGCDEIERDDYDFDSNTVQSQIDELKQLMISLSQTVQALSVQQENATSGRANVGSTAGPPAALEQQRQANTLGIPPPGQEQPHQRIRESPERTAYTNTIIKDVIGVLPEYDPVRGNITSQQFISKTEQLQRVYEWNDGTVLFAIQHKIRGVANEWLDAQTVFQSWEQFKTALLQDFPS